MVAIRKPSSGVNIPRELTPYLANQVLALEKYLDNHDELLKASRAVYQQYTGNGIDILDYQTIVVDHALKAKGIYAIEMATGTGKSIVAARIAIEKVKQGPVLFVCPSNAALGDLAQGIINKFARTFAGLGRSPVFGNINDISAAYDVSFVTPRAFIHAYQTDNARMRGLLAKISCLIVDEAHHFPDDIDDDLKVYGDIYEIASELMGSRLTVAMTGTWVRTDKKEVMGRRSPDTRLTVQDAVSLGRCPELYGIQVITDVRASKNARLRSELYDLHLAGKEREKYYQGIVDCMRLTYRRNPVPFAAFARTKADAEAIAAIYNRQRGPKLRVLLSETTLPSRRAVITELNEGDAAGYITCAVGEEAIDIPRLEVVHLIRRTTSHARNMQAVGRALRLHKDKRRALVIDYQTMLPGMTERFLGLSLDDLGDDTGSLLEKRQRINGGPIVAQESYQRGVLVGMTIGEERKVVCAGTPGSPQWIKQRLIQLAKEGAPRPTVPQAHRAANAEQYNLGQRFMAYTRPGDTSYDPEFTATIAEIRPDWLVPDKDRRMRANKDALRERAKSGGTKPRQSGQRSDPLTNAFFNYCTRTNLKLHDPELTAELKRIRPDWFKDSADQKKEELLKQAVSGQPRPQMRRVYMKVNGKRRYLSDRRTDETRLADLLWRYITPGSKVYDPEFAKKIGEIRPDWLPKRNGSRPKPERPITAPVRSNGKFIWRGRERRG